MIWAVRLEGRLLKTYCYGLMALSISVFAPNIIFKVGENWNGSSIVLLL